MINGILIYDSGMGQPRQFQSQKDQTQDISVPDP